jgi:hypothetical protein
LQHFSTHDEYVDALLHELTLLAALIRDNPPNGTRTVLMSAKSVVRSAAHRL